MKERTLHRSEKTNKGGREYSLLLFNDEVNTFDHVIKSLVEVCGHDPVQAEQCALIAHYKGKCEILNGEFSELREIRYELTSRGLKTSIES